MKSGLQDLNALRILDAIDGDWELRDHGTSTENVRCHFRGIKDAFIDELDGYDAVVGCVAWITDLDILRSLQAIHCVSLLVQKEDFLRPDHATKSSLRKAYRSLSQPYARSELPEPIRSLSSGDASQWEAVRCVGNANTTNSSAHPRMHHKFVVFCSIEMDDDRPMFRPSKVWTGSFNLTHVGGLSLENAVVVSQQEIADAYFLEWSQVACLSEPLNWNSKWLAPQHRIGT